MEFALNLPLNAVSFGQVSMAILREIYSRGLSPCIFPIYQPDLSAFKLDNDFVEWINNGVNKSYASHSRKVPTFRLWHLDGSLESVSEKQVLMTFYELDSPTVQEINVVKNNSRVIFT